jgi:hypothetical protein
MRGLRVATAALMALGCTTSAAPNDALPTEPVQHCGQDSGVRCTFPEQCRFVGARSVCMPPCGVVQNGEVLNGEVCALGRHCIGGLCSPGGDAQPGASCETPLDCIDGYICSSVAGVPVPTCVPICVGEHYDDRECAAGTICSQTSACVPPCDPADHATCAAPHLCDRRECDYSLEGAACFMGPCSPGLICEATTQMCVDPVAADRLNPRPPGGFCVVTGGCPANSH